MVNMDNPGDVKSWLQTLKPIELERLVGEVWEEMGYTTHVTTGSNDRGIDVIAVKKDPFLRRQLIQVKRYTQTNKIGSQSVRKYRTLYMQEPDVDSVALVTSGDFTPQARELASDLGVETLDGFELGSLIQEEAEHIFEEWISHDSSGSDIESGQPGKQESEAGDRHKYGHLIDQQGDLTEVEEPSESEDSHMTEQGTSHAPPPENNSSLEDETEDETEESGEYEIHEEEIRQFYSELDL